MAENIPYLYDLIDMNNPDAIMEEVRYIATKITPELDFSVINSAYHDILHLFNGSLPGYQGCTTAYHDIFHTMDVVLTNIRLAHGIATTGVDFSANDIDLIILAALMHDTGYIQRQSETTGTGAQYTAIHIERSIEFSKSYFQNNQKARVDLEALAQILDCTGLNANINIMNFQSEVIRLLGFMLGTADLIGQMSDRYYVEKLPILYEEFQEAGIPGFTSDLNFIQKTPEFYAWVMERFQNTFGGINRFMKNHFKARWDIDCDLYAVFMEKNQAYLRLIAEKPDYKTNIKRTIRTQKKT
jgi:hypothetical protein